MAADHSFDDHYQAFETASGWAVSRPDGAFAEFTDSDEAEEAAQLLQCGDATEREFLWQESTR